ncbi:histidine kinase [Leptospira wolffii]|uniref:histidine kinase dimerization/phosphoacceptor domain -containing protein n=1 Tax=Leptospira wolffii TaxID=409998 RepID=UPI0010829CBC|nr:histidine kinase dimerization/phosphoacceptor domain -containing protein [Leptospira wolffii]TGK61661.1 histidine kinase [Leptospira wolffii]TGK70205.1 histidine kinase [Leptospira wolffii]TGK77128.1 histidine kinase [Leptospira wolffii]TGL31020.1 histidine kinase [Leptospira wolffii]
MFEVTETQDLNRSIQLFFVSVITGLLCFGVIGFEHLAGNHTFRPGYTIAGIASILSAFLIWRGKYKISVYLCSVCFSLAIGFGTFYGAGLKNALIWYPVFLLFHLYFFNRQMTFFAFLFCLSLILGRIFYTNAPERPEILVDSIASLGVMTLFIVSIGANLDKLLSDKDILLKELTHRVRNNLQVVLDMVSLLKESNESFETRIALQTLERRVLALASVHAIAQNSQDVKRIPVGDVIENYLNRIVSKYKALPALDPIGKHFLLDVKDANLLLLILGEIIATVSDSVTTHIEDVRISFRNPSLSTFQLQIEGTDLTEGEWSHFSRSLLRQHGGDLSMEKSGRGRILATFGLLNR